MTRGAKLTAGHVLSCLFAISSPLRADDGAAKSAPDPAVHNRAVPGHDD